MRALPPTFDILVYPASSLRGEVRAQPSKNYTTRYLLAAALSEGESRLSSVAQSEDAEALLRCLRAFGARIELERGDGSQAVVRGFGARPRSGVTLDVGNAGAVARFLTAVAALTTQTRVITPYPESLGKRPQADLFEALRQLGVKVDAGSTLPAEIDGGAQVRGGRVTVSAQHSSQYASALMFLAPLLPEGLEMHLSGHIKSHGPLRQTLHTLAVYGVAAQASPNLRRIWIAGGQAYQPRTLDIPGDYPGAAALLVAGALCGEGVTVSHLEPEDLQGEREAAEVLREMGADIRREGHRLTVSARPLKAVSRDADHFTDAVQVLSAAAAYAEGQSHWRNVATLRLKECDRISDTRAELTRLGVTASETADSLSIVGQPQLRGGVTADGHGDHRMIMLLTLLGLRAQRPIRIRGAHHIRKSYPRFFDDLWALGARFEVLSH